MASYDKMASYDEIRAGGANPKEFNPLPRRIMPDGTEVPLLLREKREPIHIPQNATGLKEEWPLWRDPMARAMMITERQVKALHDRYMAGESVAALAKEADISSLTLPKYFKRCELTYPKPSGKEGEVPAPAAKVVPVEAATSAATEQGMAVDDVHLDEASVISVARQMDRLVQRINQLPGCVASFTFRFEIGATTDGAQHEPG